LSRITARVAGVVRIGRRRAVTSVKKNVPPGTNARRYSGTPVRVSAPDRHIQKRWVEYDPPDLLASGSGAWR
jgi:hypothetical protein